MAVSDVNMPELWVADSAFVVLAAAALLKDVVLLDIRTLGADESLPVTVTVVETMLTLWWFGDG